MNTSGNFITEAIMLAVAGRLVGGIENKLPKEAKQKAPRMIARARIAGLVIATPKARVMMMGTTEITRPKINEARISPRMIVPFATGHDINRSRVLAIVSQGTTMGDIAVAVKKRIMPSSPGIMKSTVRCLPIRKERNRKTGNSKPKITTGPLE
jgi:hypothetical protein